jgi:hypothetical protein
MNNRPTFFPTLKAGVLAGVAVAALMAGTLVANAQVTGYRRQRTAAGDGDDVRLSFEEGKEAERR